MPQFVWDASALAKRYYTEEGSDTVNALFTVSPALSMLSTYLVYAETAAILRRKRNRGEITVTAFQDAVWRLKMKCCLIQTSSCCQ